MGRFRVYTESEIKSASPYHYVLSECKVYVAMWDLCQNALFGDYV